MQTIKNKILEKIMKYYKSVISSIQKSNAAKDTTKNQLVLEKLGKLKQIINFSSEPLSSIEKQVSQVIEVDDRDLEETEDLETGSKHAVDNESGSSSDDSESDEIGQTDTQIIIEKEAEELKTASMTFEDNSASQDVVSLVLKKLQFISGNRQKPSLDLEEAQSIMDSVKPDFEQLSEQILKKNHSFIMEKLQSKTDESQVAENKKKYIEAVDRMIKAIHIVKTIRDFEHKLLAFKSGQKHHHILTVIKKDYEEEAQKYAMKDTLFGSHHSKESDSNDETIKDSIHSIEAIIDLRLKDLDILNDERESCTEAEKDSLNAKIKVVQDEANALSKVVRDLQSLFKDKVNATVPQTNIRPTIAVNRIPIVDSGYFDNNEDNVSEGSFNNDEENKSKADVFGIGVSTITQADINKSAINDLNQQPTINQIELPPKKKFTTIAKKAQEMMNSLSNLLVDANMDPSLKIDLGVIAQDFADEDNEDIEYDTLSALIKNTSIKINKFEDKITGYC